MELQILHAIQGIHQEWLTEILRFFTTIGESGLVWIVIAIVLTCIPKTRKCGLTMIIAMAITYLVGNLFLKNVIARPRPCAVDTGVTLKIPFPSEYSFPSGHTSNGFAGAVTIFSYYRKAGILSLLMAAVIAFSRLYFFVHYPTDILGGMVLGTLDAVKGKAYKVVLEYFQAGGEASLKFDIGIKKEINYKEVADKAAEADVIIFVGGLSSALEGEEMPVDLPGFRKGDRTNIDLPQVQEEMLKALKKTGKPVVFVLCSGSTLALPWEAENLDAIIEAWYPGQQGGTAVADVLFGDYNPAGRLPLTFYASSSDLPDFEDYDMSNRTYRYFKGKPLFPFGHGLSYTTFDYGKAKADKKILRAGEGVTLTIPLKNIGKLSGDEVVQVYLRNPGDKDGPIKTLRAFRRISLEAGQAEDVLFELPASTFEWFNPATNRMEVLPGKYELLYGGTSDEKALRRLTVTLKK